MVSLSLDMTRVLEALLGAKQPTFRISLNQLERAGGMPGVDIRLTTDILHRTQVKIRELGLDPKDTTPEELYHALEERLKVDERSLESALDLPGNATNQEIIATVATFLSRATGDKAFVLKGSVIKSLLKKHAPQKTMKLLGYRSNVSMLKHEPIAHIYAAAHMAESVAWWQDFRASYSQLTPSDFEMKHIAIVSPTTQRWQRIADTHSIVSQESVTLLQELGTVVCLPISNKRQVTGLALVLATLGLQAINDIRSGSSFLKFQQVRPGFSDTVIAVSQSRVYAAAQIANQPVAWQALHRYYARNLDRYPADIFEPHVQSEDLAWHAPEEALAGLSDTLDFWQDTQYCGLTDSNGQVVSLNLFDVVINYANQLPYENRSVQHVMQNVWHELTTRYLQQQNIESAIADQLGDRTTANAVL
jgi:hypothetical protein